MRTKHLHAQAWLSWATAIQPTRKTREPFPRLLHGRAWMTGRILIGHLSSASWGPGSWHTNVIPWIYAGENYQAVKHIVGPSWQHINQKGAQRVCDVKGKLWSVYNWVQCHCLISLSHSPVTQMLQLRPFLHFRAFVKGSLLTCHLFPELHRHNFSVNSHPLPDLSDGCAHKYLCMPIMLIQGNYSSM